MTTRILFQIFIVLCVSWLVGRGLYNLHAHWNNLILVSIFDTLILGAIAFRATIRRARKSDTDNVESTRAE